MYYYRKWEGRIYVGIQPSSVVCIDEESGDILWEFILEEETIDELAISKDRLIVMTKIRREGLLNCRMICLDGETGEELWVIGDSGSTIWLEEIYDDVVVFEDSRRWYIGVADMNSGALLWKENPEVKALHYHGIFYFKDSR